MIIWLASYPRSGNTLLRTLLHQHFGLATFSDEPEEYQVVGWTKTTKAMIGHKDIPCNWNQFYQQKHHSNSISLIKTHRSPSDESKAIYVVRDGRSSYVSYAKYHASFIKDKPQSLLGLILGLDFYGGWSEHYRLWTQAPNPLLILRYEDLVTPKRVTLEKIANFLGLAQPESSWKNPFVDLNQENPNFFREGHAYWQGSDDWSELIDAIFFTLHGSLMVELDYVSKIQADQAVRRLVPEIAELLTIVQRLVYDLSNYQKVCLERQVVIDELKQACDERLALIETLNRKLTWER